MERPDQQTCPHPVKGDIRALEVGAGFGPLPSRACGTTCLQLAKADAGAIRVNRPKLAPPSVVTSRRAGAIASMLGEKSNVPSVTANLNGVSAYTTTAPSACRHHDCDRYW